MPTTTAATTPGPHISPAANLASLSGPVRVGKDFPGMIAGYMGVIPPEWRALFGGPALTGLCCTSVISRSSYGPAVSVFDPDHVGTRTPIPSKLLLAYPEAHQTLGRWDGTGPLFNGTTKVGGLAFPAGTRSVLFVERHGATFCYGPATADKTLAGKPDGNTNTWCFDPTEEDKGVYGYPYQHLVLAYDAVDLLAVKEGRRSPWDVKPYTTWPLTDMASGGVATMRSAAYQSGDAPVVHRRNGVRRHTPGARLRNRQSCRAVNQAWRSENPPLATLRPGLEVWSAVAAVVGCYGTTTVCTRLRALAPQALVATTSTV